MQEIERILSQTQHCTSVDNAVFTTKNGIGERMHRTITDESCNVEIQARGEVLGSLRHEHCSVHHQSDSRHCIDNQDPIRSLFSRLPVAEDLNSEGYAFVDSAQRLMLYSKVVSCIFLVYT